MKASLLRDFVRLILESEKEDDKEEKKANPCRPTNRDLGWKKKYSTR